MAIRVGSQSLATGGIHTETPQLAESHGSKTPGGRRRLGESSLLLLRLSETQTITGNRSPVLGQHATISNALKSSRCPR